MIPSLCYGLLVIAWVIDLFTPQLFVAAILLNGPIALSSLALHPRLTLWLTILAEAANIVAGIVNGVQAGYHWDSIAIGDRLLAAASFVLVGGLTIRAQESARKAGESEERARQAERERALRHAMEHVRASLNIELVLRTAVREARKVTGADEARIAVRQSSFDFADTYEIEEGESEVRLRRARLPPEESSLIERAREAKRVVTVDADDPLGRLVGATTLIAAFDTGAGESALMLSWKHERPSDAVRSDAQAFAENLAVALQQTALFVRLAAQREEITQQKDALQARNEVIRDIVYALAHDLRTPLTAADLTMNQALNGAYGELPEAYRGVLRTNITSNADLRRLVETLLLVARYESGEDSRVCSRVSIAPLLERIVSEMQPIAGQKNVRLILTAAMAAEVEADADEVRRAITNLVANAIEATPSGGEVHVLASSGDGITIDVIDDGYGVPSERRAQLFERFAGLRSGFGTGLGLYIVRRIAEKYGGSVRYEPREPRGSRFTVHFPKRTKSR